MNRIHRKGVDIGIAFSTVAKRLSYSASQTETEPAEAGNVAVHGGQESEYAHKPAPLFSRLWIRKTLWTFALWGFRVAKPFLEPIAIIVRHYFTEELRQGILQEIQRTTDVTVLELRARNEAVTARLDGAEEHLTARLDGVVKEVQIRHEALTARLDGVVKELRVRNDDLAARLERTEQYSYATARRVAVSCGPGEVLIKTDLGFVMCAASDYSLLACLIDTGELERGTRILIQRFLRPGDVYVDVGANIGMHTLAAAKAMQGEGKIIAFEPFKPTTEMLEKSVWINGFSGIVEIHQAAVSNVAGHENLYLGITSGHHSLFELDDASRGPSREPVEVPLVRLDQVIAPGQRIDLLKIDAEGAELEVIEGGASLVASNPDIALIVEFGPSHLRRRDQRPEQWLGTFTGLGLSYRAINAYSGALEEWSVEQLEQVDSVNLFFSRDNSRAWSRLTA